MFPNITLRCWYTSPSEKWLHNSWGALSLLIDNKFALKHMKALNREHAPLNISVIENFLLIQQMCGRVRVSSLIRKAFTFSHHLEHETTCRPSPYALSLYTILSRYWLFGPPSKSSSLIVRRKDNTHSAIGISKMDLDYFLGHQIFLHIFEGLRPDQLS